MKLLGWAALTITLGALGSGVWENVLKPLLRFTTRAAFAVVTLGIDRFRDAEYAEAAKGFHEQSSLYVAALITGASVGFIAGAVLVVVGRRRLRRLAASPSNRERLRPPLYIAMFMYFFLVVGFTCVEGFRISYINQAVTHYQQLLQATRPYLTDADALALQSRFAQVRTRGDYVAVINQLELVCKQRGLRCEHFEAY